MRNYASKCTKSRFLYKKDAEIVNFYVKLMSFIEVQKADNSTRDGGYIFPL